MHRNPIRVGYSTRLSSRPKQAVDFHRHRDAARVRRVDEHPALAVERAPAAGVVGDQERDRVDDQRREDRLDQHPAGAVDDALAAADLDDGQALVGESVDVATV